MPVADKKIPDEEIVKSRYFEEDRKFHICYSSFSKVISTKDETERDISLRRLKRNLAQLELAAKQNVIIAETNQLEADHYSQCAIDQDELILQTKEEVENLRKVLTEAKELRANRIQYDMLTVSINEHPARDETQSKISIVESKIEELKQNEKDIESRFSHRSKQFHGLLVSAQELSTSLIDEKEMEEKRLAVEKIKEKQADMEIDQ